MGWDCIQEMATSIVISVRKAELQKRGFIDFTDWQAKEGHLYIGRNMDYYVKGAKASKWANPFSVKKYGLDECLRLYEKHIRETMLSSIDELQNVKEFGCWCKPNACHGDVLLKILHSR